MLPLELSVEIIISSHWYKNLTISDKSTSPWLGSSVGWNTGQYTKKGGDSIPCQGTYRRQLIAISLSNWCFSHFSLSLSNTHTHIFPLFLESVNISLGEDVKRSTHTDTTKTYRGGCDRFDYFPCHLSSPSPHPCPHPQSCSHKALHDTSHSVSKPLLALFFS